MNLKNIISILIIIMLLLVIPGVAVGQAPPLNFGIITGTVLSSEEEMLFPEEKPVNMHDFAGYGSVFGTPQSGLHDIGPHLGNIGPDLSNIGPHFTYDQFGAWGEPCSIGAWGQFYGLGVI